MKFSLITTSVKSWSCYVLKNKFAKKILVARIYVYQLAILLKQMQFAPTMELDTYHTHNILYSKGKREIFFGGGDG